MEQSAITTVRIIQRKESQVLIFESEDNSGEEITIGSTMFKCIASTHGPEDWRSSQLQGHGGCDEGQFAFSMLVERS